MKLFIYIIIVISMLLYIQPANPVYASDVQYYRITSENTLLYKTPEINEDNIYFELPATYFVIYLNTCNDFIQVQYQDITGYVLENNITKVYSKPTTPFPENITLNINATASAIVRDIPSIDGNYIGLLPYNTTANYIGKTIGTEAISNMGDIWYFVSYKTEQSILYGYVYAPLTENLPSIPINDEIVATSSINNSNIISPELLNPNNIFLILGLSFISLLLIFLLFAPTSQHKNCMAKTNK